MQNYINILDVATFAPEMSAITTIGALTGLILAVVLIIKKVNPAYSLILGAIVGGLIGGGGLIGTVDLMLEGARGFVTAILRIMTAGVLAGVLIKTGSAAKIANSIAKGLPGKKGAIIAIATSTMILTGVGVFIDVAVITVAPIALATAKKLSISPMAVLLAMIGGGKSGNMISPNPNAIIIAENFGIELSNLMIANIPAVIFGLLVTIFLSIILIKKFENQKIIVEIEDQEISNLPSFWSAISGPFVVVVLLALRPVFNINVDPLIALPVGGVVSSILTGQIKKINEHITFGLSRMTPIVILFLGTGAIAGIIGNSEIQNDLVKFLNWTNMPLFLLAPISGILMSAATASTTAGAAIASASFGPAIINAVGSSAGAAMVHTGATVLDHLPHGTFFHSTGGVASLDIKQRMKLIPFESLVGITMTIISTIMWGIILQN